MSLELDMSPSKQRGCACMSHITACTGDAILINVEVLCMFLCRSECMARSGMHEFCYDKCEHCISCI